MKNKIIYICMVFVMIVTFTCTNLVIAASKPRVAVGGPSSGTAEVGGTIRYTVNIYNNATSVNLNSSSVTVHNASANVSVEGSGNTSRTIVLSNIQGSVGSSVFITVAAGVATNEKGSSLATPQSTSFTIVATTPSNPPPPDNNQNNNNSGNNGNNGGGNTLPPNSGNNNKPQDKPEEKKDETAPTMEIGRLSKKSVKIGEDISFEVQYKDETEMGEITLNKNDITLYGFKADIKVSGDGNKRVVTLSNIQGNLGGLKYVKIGTKTAKDKAGNQVKEDGKTEVFKVVDNSSKNKPDDWIENPNTGR